MSHNISLFDSIDHTFDDNGTEVKVTIKVVIPGVPVALRIADRMRKTMRENGIDEGSDLKELGVEAFIAFADAQESVYDMILPHIVDVQGLTVEGVKWSQLTSEWKVRLFAIMPGAVFIPVYDYIMKVPEDDDLEQPGEQDPSQQQESEPRSQ